VLKGKSVVGWHRQHSITSSLGSVGNQSPVSKDSSTFSTATQIAKYFDGLQDLKITIWS